MTEQYFMRTTDAEGRAHGGFQWPMEVGAIVTAPDWNPEPVCGGGLHGLLNGGGGASHLSFAPGAIWWIVAAAGAVDLDGKHKFKSCRVVAFGARDAITQEMRRISLGAPVHGLIATGGDWSTLTGGDRSALTGGDWSTLTGGDRSALTGGNSATLTGGDWSALTGGNWSALTGGNSATLTGGNSATLTGGDSATLTGGDYATLTGGNWSALTGGNWSALTGGNSATLTGGDYATLTGGDYATLTGGNSATLVFMKWTDGRRRVLTAYVGEDGILPGVAYMASYGFKSIIRSDEAAE